MSKKHTMKAHDPLLGFQDERVFLESLTGDVVVIEGLLGREDTQPLRRALVRAVFVEVEGLLFRLRERAKVKSQLPGFHRAYSKKDLNQLFPKRFQRFNEKAKVALKLLYERRDTSERAYPPDLGGTGWRQFLAAKRTRDRLMHPTSTDDLTVTDSELREVRNARDWLRKSLREQNEAVKKDMDKAARDLWTSLMRTDAARAMNLKAL